MPAPAPFFGFHWCAPAGLLVSSHSKPNRFLKKSLFHRVGVLVTKDSGGPDAKLVAARALRVPVIVVDRPAPPAAPAPPPPAPAADLVTPAQVAEQLDQFLVSAGAVGRINGAGREHGQIRAFNNRTFDVAKAVP